MANEVWTIKSLISWTENYLKQKGFADSARLDTQILLAHVLKCKKIDLYVRSEEIPTEAERAAFKSLLKQRVDGTPVEYILGFGEFHLLTFEVSPAVLIPREDTSILVAEAVRILKERNGGKVVDIGTGSGCIAISLAKESKVAEITAIDISEDALAVARRNAAKHEFSERIRFLQGDMFEALPPDEKFDLIVSNPPYIAHDEFPGLDVGVRDHEPRLALDGGEDGLKFYRRLANDTPLYLKPGGWLLMEIGYTQNEAVRGLLESVGGYELETTIQDKARHPRVVRAKWKG